jgi:nucleotide-binding universal stress UspA family protein
MISIRTILVPTDFSDCSRYAFQLAAALAKEQPAHLIVIHVSQKLDSMVAYSNIFPHLQPQEYKDYLLKLMHTFQVDDPKISLEYYLVEGEPTREILRMAEKSACNMIIMGTHGRTGIERLILGSVAEHILRKAACPVVTVKLPKATPVPAKSKGVKPVTSRVD